VLEFNANPPQPLAVELRRRGITNRQFAHAIGSNEFTVSRVVNGRQRPSPMFRKMCVIALDLPESALFGGG